MSHREDLEFRVIMPQAPATVLATFTSWLPKYGTVANSQPSADGANRVVDVICIRIFRQDTLQRSLRTKLTRAGLASVCAQVFVRSMPKKAEEPAQPIASQTREELEALAKKLSTNNFGHEDTSYLTNPAAYVEKTMAGLRMLLKDIYLNDDQKQNHTVRLNMAAQTAEVHQNGAWNPLAIPVASDRMIRNCRMHFLRGFNQETHKDNDAVMDFMVTLYTPATEAPLKADIAAGLVKRNKQPS